MMRKKRKQKIITLNYEKHIIFKSFGGSIIFYNLRFKGDIFSFFFGLLIFNLFNQR